MQNTEMPVGSPEKKSGKLIWPRYKLKWQIKLAQGVANNFGHIPPKVENYHGPRHLHFMITKIGLLQNLTSCIYYKIIPDTNVSLYLN